jgi:hypothetical protein
MNAKHAISLAVLLAAQFSFSNPAAAQAAPSKSRAEVRAELALWQRAGLYGFLETRPTDLDEYERRVQTFIDLRNGPAYQSELARIQGSAALVEKQGDRPARNH